MDYFKMFISPKPAKSKTQLAWASTGLMLYNAYYLK